MDSGPTLDVIDGICDDDEEEEGDMEEKEREVWGRLFPLIDAYYKTDLVNEEYTFGRGDECDYCFESPSGKKPPQFLALSKTHFRVYREKDKSDPSQYLVFIQDKSSNGTYINGENLGRNKKQVLNHDDEISLATSKNKAFIFNDCGRKSDIQSLPQEFREKYVMSKLLGRGACGEVKLAFQKGTSDKFAVKIISKRTFSVGPKLGRAALEEVKILKSLQHPCIINIVDVIESFDALYIVLELVEGGELFDRVVDKGKFSEPVAKLYFYQMLSAVKYLHDSGITHRDMKPENVLLSSDREETLLKVTDFGLSRFVGENSLMKTLCGTPSYLAPEVLQTAGTAGYNKAVDCWSMGVILYIMLGGYPPFSDELTDFSLHDQICQARYSFPDKYWGSVSDEGKDLIKRLLTIDPKQRISTTEALEHPWMQDEEVVGKAKKIMETAARNLEEMAPPSGMPDKTRKRSAPCSDEDDSSFNKPVKRPTIEASSPLTEAPPTFSSPSSSANDRSDQVDRSVIASDADSTTSEEVSRSLSNES